MTITDCENIIKSYFESNFGNYEHLHNKKLIVSSSNYRIVPDDRFYKDKEMILIEYENTKRPVESISKYWWLLKNTNWLKEKIKIKLFIIGLNEVHKGIRDESVEILGSELKSKFPDSIDFFYVPWNKVSEIEILKILNQITKNGIKL